MISQIRIIFQNNSQAFEPSVLTSIRRGFSGMKNCTEELGIVRTELARFPERAPCLSDSVRRDFELSERKLQFSL